MGTLGTAKASPTKAFFVRMLTRDITLEDCILDLIDNSVDGSWDLSKGGEFSFANRTDLSPHKIELTLSEDHFTISDNCGGISLEDAVNYAFTFGRATDARDEEYSIGVYGIGMKRAVFKIGRSIDIRSTYTDPKAGIQSFKVPINVPTWLREPESQVWDFDLDDDAPLEAAGVKIEISDLEEGASTSFGSQTFIRDLRKIIARDYAFFLHLGLQIAVNGRPVKGWNVELRQSEEFKPLRKKLGAELTAKGVSAELIAGMSAFPPEEVTTDDMPTSEETSGWYFVCNGRIVVAADRTELSGWGTTGVPKWHPQYSGFVGFVSLSAISAGDLPLTTTKRSIDRGHAAYRRTLSHIKNVSKSWTSYTNEKKHAPTTSSEQENNTKPVSAFELKINDEILFPTYERTKKKPQANILYKIEVGKARELANALGNINMSYKEIGERSFNFTYENCVD